MANINAPFGFVPIRHGSGGIGGRTNEYNIASGLAANIFEGDPVVSDGSNNITKATAGDTGTITGIFKGVQYTAVDGSIVYDNKWVSGTVTQGAAPAKALVHDDPNQHFMVQAHANFEAADIGQLANIVIPNPAGNSITGKSLVSLSDIGGTEAQVKIIRALSVPGRSDVGHGNSVIGANAIVEVKIARHELAGTAAAIEV